MTHHLVCPHCNRKFPRWYWYTPNLPGHFGSKKHRGLALGNFRRHVEACQEKQKDMMDEHTISCPECGSMACTSVSGPDEDGLCEYRCDDCGGYFVDDAVPGPSTRMDGSHTNQKEG